MHFIVYRDVMLEPWAAPWGDLLSRSTPQLLEQHPLWLLYVGLRLRVRAEGRGR